jgi:signal transduction histidine kinase
MKLLRICSSILILFSPFFMGEIFSQNTTFFQHNVELDAVVGQSQLVVITKDKNGYYWMLSASHKILKWDGRNFTRMDSLPAYKLSLKDYSFQLCYDKMGTPYFFHAGKIILYIDESSQLKVRYQKNGNVYDIKTHVNGPYYSHKIPWDIVKSMNSKAVYNEFYEAYFDYNVSSINGVGNDTFYMSGKFGEYYYCNGVVTKIRDGQETDRTLFLVDAALVMLFSNGNYEVYKAGRLVASGNLRQPEFSQSFHKFNRSKILNWWQQRQYNGKGAFFASGKCIYKLTLSNNIPVLSKYFDISGEQQYTDFYCDLEKERVFLINTRGGFTYFERNPIFAFPYREKIGNRVIYSISKRPDGVLLSNSFFQESIKFNFKKESSAYSVSPIIYHKGKYYYFFGNTAFVINTAGQVDKKIPIPPGGQIYAAAATDSVVYFQNGNLYSLHNNSGTAGIRELAFFDNDKKISIDYIEKGSSHVLYASSKANGYIYELNVKKLSARKLTRLPISECRSICYDREKNLLLIATYGNGPVIVSLADGRQIDLPMDASSSLLSCHYFLPDRDGDLWLPTNLGLFYLSAADLALYLKGKIPTLAYRQIEKEFNMPSIEYNGAFSTSGIQSGDSAFFSSMDGIVGINTVYIKSLFKEGKTTIFLDEVKINGAIAGLDDLKWIDPSFKSLEFKFSIPFIQHPGVLLQYRILGYKDTTWQYLPADKLTLGYLTPGSYTLEVRTTNDNWLEMRQIPVHINAYWYHTGIARALFVLSALLFIGIIVRTIILKNRNNVLAQLNRNKQELFRIIAHDLKSPVSLYSGLADLAAYLIQKQDFERLKKVSQEIDETTQELDLLLKNLLHWSLVENEEFHFKTEKVVVNDLLNQILPIYKRIAAVKGVCIELKLGNGTTIHSNHNGLSIVFRNLLDNAIKYAVPNSVLIVESNFTEFSYSFKVYNSISIQQKERLEELKKRGANKNDVDVNPISGLGMDIIKKMLLKLDGQLYIVVEDNNVVCSIVIPAKGDL